MVGKWAIVQLRANVDAATYFRAAAIRGVGACQNTSGSTALNPTAAPRCLGVLNPRLRLHLVESARAEDGLALAARLSPAAEVEAVTPDLYLERRQADFNVPPNDPRYRGQWYLSRLKIERAWGVAAGDPTTTVVVIDSGCDLKHPDLASAIVGGLDLIDDDDDASYAPNVDGNEHGTACAGIIAAVGDNEIGIAGACPRCTLRCVRLLDRANSLVPISSDVAAFNYAFETEAAVVSNSWGFAEPQAVAPVLRRAVEEVLERGRGGRGAIVVFAAGNENRLIDDDELVAIPGVLNVGAVNNFDEAAPFSNQGNSLSLTAPTGTLTTDISGADGSDPGDYTSLFGGTSSACPVVAGVGALLASVAPDRSGREITDLLISTARNAPFAVPDANGHDRLYGHGIIDPVAALQALGFEVPEPAPPSRRDAGTPDAGDESDADASAADSGEPAGGGGGKKNDSDSGCSATRIGAARPSVAVLIGLSLVAFGRRRTRRSLQRQHQPG